MNTASIESAENEERSPIIFYCDELDGLEYLWPRLEERFRQTGHTRQILFREYDSYKELPGTDGDLYTYDAIALSALVDKGFFRSLPKTVSCRSVFLWIMEKKQDSPKILRRSIYAVCECADLPAEGLYSCS